MFAMGLALGKTDQQLDCFFDPDHLHRALEAPYKLVFAMAVNSLTAPVQDSQSELTSIGLRTYQVDAIRVVRTIAILVEVPLGVVSALALLLLFLT